MTNLANIDAPRPGNPFGELEIINIGGFFFEKRGSLTGKEIQWFERRELARVDNAIPLLELTQEISEARSVAPKEAYAAVQSFGTGEGAHLLVGHTEQLKALKGVLSFEQDFPRDIVTMMIQSRIDCEWLIWQSDNLKSTFKIELTGNWKPTKEQPHIWAGEHTLKLPGKLINQIVSFAMSERREWTVIEAEEAEEDLGESLTRSTTAERKAKQTGAKSTTKSKKQGFQTADSSQTTS